MTTVELRPDRFAAGGEAIARDADGRVVFVRGALPGETVRAELTIDKRDWARASVLEVVEGSPSRVPPPCASRRAGCGGCGWQHVDPAAQRQGKLDIVADALRRLGGVPDAVVVAGGGVAPEGYRTTLRVSAGAGGAAGFRAEHSHDVVPAPACLVAHPELRAVVAELRLDDGVDVTVRHSVSTGVTGAFWDERRGGVRGVPDGVVVGAAAILHEDVAGRRLQVSLGSFFQSGPEAAALLVQSVRSAAPELEQALVVVDAYAGIGLFGACATPAGAHVIAVETSRSAIADARVNLADRAEIVRGEVGGWRPPSGCTVDLVIADPARSGLGRPGVSSLTRTGAPVLVLVSCDPASLGRDAKLLRQGGYHHERSEVVDTFPHTPHVEVVSRFTRR